MSRAKTGAAAPHPTHHLVWQLLARAPGAASWACSFGASWCSATAWRRRIPHACALRRLRRASSRRCGQLYPPAARQDCGSGSIASHYRALLTRPQIGSGGRLQRRRSELWWWPRGAAYERHQTSAYGPRSSANVETSSLHHCIVGALCSLWLSLLGSGQVSLKNQLRYFCCQFDGSRSAGMVRTHWQISAASWAPLHVHQPTTGSFETRTRCHLTTRVTYINRAAAERSS